MVAATGIIVTSTHCAAASSADERSAYALSIGDITPFTLGSASQPRKTMNDRGKSSSRQDDRPDAQAHSPQDMSPLLAGKPFAIEIAKAAEAAALDIALVHAVVFVESRYNARARSPKGAVGLMQVLPSTASRYGVSDPDRSPEENLKVGTRHLSYLVRYFTGRLDLALAAYNAGENAVRRHGFRIPPYAETLSYVPAVLAKYREWQEPPVRRAPASPAPQPLHKDYLSGTRLDDQSAM